MTKAKRRVALLIEIPTTDDDNEGIRRLRSLLKAMLRCWGIRCVAAKPPERTQAFGKRESETKTEGQSEWKQNSDTERPDRE